MNATINSIQTGEDTRLAAVWNEAFPDIPLTGSDFRRQFNAFGLAPDDCRVARVDNEAVGFAIATQHRIPFVAPHPLHGRLAAIAVDRHFRGRGIGKRLVRSAESHLRNNGQTTLRVGYPTYLRGTFLSLLGVDIQWVSAVRFLAKQGYAPEKVIDSMVLDLNDHNLSGQLGMAESDPGTNPVFTALTVVETDAFMYFLRTGFPESWHAQFSVLLETDALCHEQVLVMKQQDKIIGFAGPFAIGPNGDTCGVGLGIAPEFRGQGMGLKLLDGIRDFVRRRGARHLTLFGAVDKIRYYRKAGYELGSFWLGMAKRLAPSNH